MSEDAKDLRRQELALGAVSFGQPRPGALQDDPRAHELEAKVRGLAAEIRTKEREQDRAEGAREEREAVVRDLVLNKEMDPAADLPADWIMGFQAARSAFARRIEAGEHRKP